jgi:hypothetical protein
MPEPSRAAVNADDDIALRDRQLVSDMGIEDLCDPLHLEIVVPGTEGSHLIALSVACLLRDMLRLGSMHGPVLFDTVEVFS